jgi:hypothetical protein
MTYATHDENGIRYADEDMLMALGPTAASVSRRLRDGELVLHPDVVRDYPEIAESLKRETSVPETPRPAHPAEGTPRAVVESEPARHCAGTRARKAPAVSAADGMVRRATRFLPPVHQNRYGEEFLSELAEIATDRGRWGQLGYALRVAVRSLTLRRALRAEQSVTE